MLKHEFVVSRGPCETDGGRTRLKKYQVSLFPKSHIGKKNAKFIAKRLPKCESDGETRIGARRGPGSPRTLSEPPPFIVRAGARSLSEQGPFIVRTLSGLFV